MFGNHYAGASQIIIRNQDKSPKYYPKSYSNQCLGGSFPAIYTLALGQHTLLIAQSY